MGGMLINDDDAIFRLGHDIGCVHLRPGSPQRIGCQGRDLCDLPRGGVDLTDGFIPCGGRKPLRPLKRIGRCGKSRRWWVGGAIGISPAAEAGLARIWQAAGAKCPQSCAGHRGGGTVPSLRQGMFQGTDDQPAHQPRFLKTHLCFRRMHIHIHRSGFTFQKQRQQGMAIPGQKILIGPTYRANQLLVPHRATIHEQKLHRRIATIQGWHPGIAGQVKSFPLRINRQGVFLKFPPHNRPQAL